MARGYKTGGRQKGSLNKRTMARAELQSRHGVGAASPALSKMRECAEWMLGLAGEEQKKGEEADCRLVKEYLDSAARILREVAQYEAPKLTAVSRRRFRKCPSHRYQDIVRRSTLRADRPANSNERNSESGRSLTKNWDRAPHCLHNTETRVHQMIVMMETTLELTHNTFPGPADRRRAELISDAIDQFGKNAAAQARLDVLTCIFGGQKNYFVSN